MKEVRVPVQSELDAKVLNEDAERFGLEPTNSEDVVLGAEIGGVGGAVAGAIAGAALGVPGAITGAVIGGVLGAAGSAAAVAAVDKIDDDDAPSEPNRLAPADEFVAESVELHEADCHPEDSEPVEGSMIPRKTRPENPPEPPAEIDPEARAKDGVPFVDPSHAEGAAQHIRKL